jgi:hypothetical protein
VPAKVDGLARGAGRPDADADVPAGQGTLKTGNNSVPEGKLLGEQISFRAGPTEYSGRVTASGMQGTLTSGVAWTASRAR